MLGAVLEQVVCDLLVVGVIAANGVIVITTKRGHAGATLWNAYARAAQTSIPAPRYPEARGAVGLDVGARNRYSLLRGGDAPGRGLISIAGTFDDYNNGIVTDTRGRQVVTTGDLGVSASARRGRFTFRTSVGTQYVRSLTDVLVSEGSSLPPGGSSVGQAANKSSSQSYDETVTLGGYLEQRVGLNDRLFLTGALRIDGASTFGQNYTATAYPKAGVSWLASAEPFFPRVPGLDELRLRYAFGASGQQPLPQHARPAYGVTQGFVNDMPQDVVRLTALGNPDLRPERVREHEFGFDAAGLEGRARPAPASLTFEWSPDARSSSPAWPYTAGAEPR